MLQLIAEGKTTKDAQEASKLMGALKQEEGLARLQVVLKRLSATPEVTSVGVTVRSVSYIGNMSAFGIA